MTDTNTTETTELTAPESGEVLNLTVTVIDAQVATRGNHWGDNLKMAVRIEDGLGGVHYADVRATVDNAGPWFTKAYGKKLAVINGEVEVADDETGETTDEVEAAELPSHSDIDNMTNKELRALGTRLGVEFAKRTQKVEMVSRLKSAVTDAQTEDTSDEGETEDVEAAA